MPTTDTNNPENPTSSMSGSLLTSSVMGAAILLVGFGVAGIAVPYVWDAFIAKSFGQLGFLNSFLRSMILLAAVIAVVFAVSKLLPANPPVGTRGGIAIIISVVIALLFIARALGVNLAGDGTGYVIFTVAMAALLFGAYKLVTSKRCADWMITLEKEGFFHTHLFKKTQGLRVRRITLISLAVLGFSGIYAMIHTNSLPVGNWPGKVTFLGNTFENLTLIPDLQYSLPLILAVAVGWMSWRAVNTTTFGDFLIATDAEMNKVSWPTGKKLAQDTVVVLVTTALLTMFLLITDLVLGGVFKGIGVLPSQKDTPANVAGQGPAW